MATIPSPAPAPSPTATPPQFHPLPINGAYRLSITLGPSCEVVVLRRFHQRAWDVAVTNQNDLSLLAFVGPERIFPDRTAGLCSVCGFVSVPPDERVHVLLEFQEQTDEYLLAYDLQAMDASLMGDTITGRALGRFVSLSTSAERAECLSDSHTFTLTPR